jgi:PIF1 helicase.
MQDFGLPEPMLCMPEVMAKINTYADHADELNMMAQQKVNCMNEEQLNTYGTVYENVFAHHDSPTTYVSPFFIEGKPGRGKTFVLDALCCRLRSDGLIVLIVGTSALAATLYEGGRTAHNLFQLPVTEVWLSYIASEIT